MIARTFLAILTIGFCTTAAVAHAFLNHADPGAGAALTQPPKEISLTFTEKLEPTFSGVSISDSTGHDMEAASPVVSGTSITVALKPLATGSYRVAWHAVSVDSHRTEGSYSFSIKP